MIRELRIQNFKGWEDTGPIQLAPLTIFFGTNSSGKTSLLQFLLLLKQTAQSPDRRLVLHYGDSGTPIQLGTYRDLVHQHEVNRPLGFSLEWDLPDEQIVRDARSEREYRGNRMSFGATLGANGAGKDRVMVQRFEYGLHAEGTPPATVLTAGMRREEGTREEYVLESPQYTFVKNQGRPGQIPAPRHFYGFPEEVQGFYQNADWIGDLAFSLEHLFRQTYYLGPLRVYPERGYIWSGEMPEDVGWRGERAVHATLAARERKLQRGHGKHRHPFAVVLATELRTLGVIHEFKVEEIAPESHQYRVEVRITSSAPWVNIKDVGFGVSQILPVAVECFYAPAGSTIIMEQPEIHLHPSVQANMADLLIHAIGMHEAGGPRKVQLIVESHSEHFLRRVQRRIAEGKLPAESVAAYFCSQDGKTSRLDRLDVDLCGYIRNWPTDFFGNEMEDIAKQQLAALRRQSASVSE